MIGLGYHGTITPGGDPAQRAGGPELVHRLHAVPARDLPGPARGAAQLPDRRRRPRGPAHRQRLAARRGHRGGGGDDARTPRPTARRPAPSSSTPTPCPQTIDVVRTRAEAMGIEVVGRRPRPTGLPDGELSGLLIAYPGASGRVVDPRPLDRGGPRAQRPGRRRLRPARPDPAGGTGRPRGRRGRSARRSGSACRCSTAARTPGSWRSARVSSGTCPAAWSGCPSTSRAGRPTAWPCRPASSTSAATRRRPTSAPPRCCWRWWPRCTPSTTAPTGLRAIAPGRHR